MLMIYAISGVLLGKNRILEHLTMHGVLLFKLLSAELISPKLNLVPLWGAMFRVLHAAEVLKM